MSFDQARAAMEKQLGGGPVDPSKLSSDGVAPQAAPPGRSDSTPDADSELDGSFSQDASFDSQTETDQSENTENPETDSSPEPRLNKQELEEILDVAQAGNKKFKIDGKIYTAAELKNSLLRYSDYTRKTQATAELRKQTEKTKQFYQHFKADLPKLIENPALEDQFRQVYPKEIQEIYDTIKGRLGVSSTKGNQSDSRTSQSSESQADPKIIQVLQDLASRVDSFEQDRLSAQQSRANAELDRIITTMSKKYDLGNADDNKLLEDVALMEAEAYEGKLTPKVMESFFEKAHKRITGIGKSQAKRIFSSQKEANDKAKDTARGGGIAGAAPQQPKTLKEAREAFEKHLQRTGGRL